MAITGLSHVGLSTPDLPRAVSFYRDGLGFDEVVSYSWPVGMDAADAGLGVVGSSADLTVLNAGNTYLEVLQFNSPTPIRIDDPPSLYRQGITHIGLEVIDLDVAVAHLLGHGARALEPSHDASSAACRLLRDPDGNVLELRTTSAGDSLDYGSLRIHVPSLNEPLEANGEAATTTLGRDSPARHHVRGIGHVGVATLGADELTTFYSLAGLGVGADVSWDLRAQEPVEATRAVSSAGRAVVMPMGNAYLELLEYHDLPVRPRPSDARIIEYGFNHLCFDIDDIAGTHALLGAAGMTCFANWTRMPGGNAAMGYALDPCGNAIELLEHLTVDSTMWPGHLSI